VNSHKQKLDIIIAALYEVSGGRIVAINALACILAAVFVGLVSVFYANFFHLAEMFSLHILKSVPVWVYIPFSVLIFVLSYWICEQLAPKASGTGVAQTIEALKRAQEKNDPHDVKEYLSTKVGITKMASSLLAIIGGSALGREGPTVQISAGIFATIARRIKKYEPNIDLQTWLIAGSAAGVAAAFNTPLGGIVFAIEELANRSFSRLKTYVLVAVIAAGLTAQAIMGPYLLFGYPKIALFTIRALPGLLLTAIICGILAQLLKLAIEKGARFRLNTSRKNRYGITIFCGLTISLLSLKYSGLIMGGGITQMSELLFNADYTVGFEELTARLLATALSVFSGVAGGLLSPALTLGAYVGSAINQFQAISSDHNFLVICGMVAFLSAMLRAPLTSIILVVEMTDRHSSIFAIMTAAVLGYATSFAAERSFKFFKNP